MTALTPILASLGNIIYLHKQQKHADSLVWQFAIIVKMQRSRLKGLLNLVRMIQHTVLRTRDE